MAFSTGNNSITLAELKSKVTDCFLSFHYLGVKKIPCIISSPLRKDNHPSFGLYSRDGEKVNWVDFATKEGGSLYDLLCKMWHCSFKEMLNRIGNDLDKFDEKTEISTHTPYEVQSVNNNTTDLQVKVREWKEYDIDYWASYGISLEWLEYAEVYPISHIIWVKEGKRFVMGANKYAYAFVEHKEGRDTIKVYQPFSKDKRYKWLNKHDRSVISLWTKIPESGDKVVICSSLKDALCLWANTGIPAIAVQGEGYGISNTALLELKRRFKKVYILFDNDKAGLADGKKLSEQTGFINVVLPPFKEGKDVSDLYKAKPLKVFLSILNTVINFRSEEFDTLPDQN